MTAKLYLCVYHFYFFFQAKTKSSGDKTSCQISKDQLFFTDPLNVRVQPLGASSSASTSVASSASGPTFRSPASALPPTSTTSSRTVATQPPPLPPRFLSLNYNTKNTQWVPANLSCFENKTFVVVILDGPFGTVFRYSMVYENSGYAYYSASFDEKSTFM